MEYKKKCIVSLNLGFFGSTGFIMRNIHKKAINEGFIFKMAAPKTAEEIADSQDAIYIGTPESHRFNQYGSILSGLDGCYSVFATKKLLRQLDVLTPDLIHLHNLHYAYINLPMLFRYIKKRKIKTVWTLHDCWPFTGHCPHFAYEQCEKWKTGCYRCPRYQSYPKSIFDNSSFMWKLKKHWFTGVEDMQIITPSHWLKELVEQSYMGGYPVAVINNGINLDIFCPTLSDFREKYGIAKNKQILLGVSFSWGKKKGLDVFLELEKRLDKDKYQIVLVGTNQEIDDQLPETIISIHKTNNQQELAEIYTAADLLVNPTREDNYPTVNMEAIACGTPVLTFRTGGSSEMLNETCGNVVPCDDVDAMEREIVRICTEQPYSQKACVEQAKNFDQERRFGEYIELYKRLLKN